MLQVSGSTLNFLESFWKRHGKQDEVPPSGPAAQVCVCGSVGLGCMHLVLFQDQYQVMANQDRDLQAFFERTIGAKAKCKKVEEVDMPGALEAAGLLKLFHVDLWPGSAAVRELATQLKSRTGLIHSDLHK